MRALRLLLICGALLTALGAPLSAKAPDFAETKKKAEAGNASAQFNLGLMYAKGEGVPKDDAEALRWYRKAADQGNALAQSNLGVMYANGRGVPKDDAEALRWYRKAADQGNAPAQSSLGVMYAIGEGVPKDDAEAYAWYNLAAISDDDARKRRDELEKTLTPEQKARAQQRSTELHNEIEARKKAAGK